MRTSLRSAAIRLTIFVAPALSPSRLIPHNNNNNKGSSYYLAQKYLAKQTIHRKVSLVEAHLSRTRQQH